MQENICRTVISGEEQNLNEQMANLQSPYFFHILCTFWPNSILFQGLKNRFHNSILFQYLQYRLGTLSIPKYIEEICEREIRSKRIM